jgi:hypothetical protein
MFTVRQIRINGRSTVMDNTLEISREIADCHIEAGSIFNFGLVLAKYKSLCIKAF